MIDPGGEFALGFGGGFGGIGGMSGMSSFGSIGSTGQLPQAASSQGIMSSGPGWPCGDDVCPGDPPLNLLGTEFGELYKAIAQEEEGSQGTEPIELVTQVASAADTAFRWLVFDYRVPLGGSYLLEAATLIPIAKVAKGVKAGRAVIGKLDDLATIRPDEHTLLKHLPDRGSPRANWQQNSSVLRREIRKGNPIRDASVDPKTGALRNDTGFLRAERNLLRNQGWTYNPGTLLWSPPVP